MTDLIEPVKGYLEAEGFTVSRRGRDLLVGTRRTISEDNEYVYIWVPTIGEPTTFHSREGNYLARFKEVADIDPSAPKYLVLPSLEGLSNEFRTGSSRWYKVKVRTPVQLFDTDLKWELSRQAPSAAKELKDRGKERLQTRVPQPYVLPDMTESGDDLLDTLSSILRHPTKQQKTIHMVIGPAGIGKSFLFESLFADLHEAFMGHKLRHDPPSPRPFPLLPDYLPLADSSTVRSLLTAYLQTDFARPLRREVFEWMLGNGFAIWMLDGLDEVISQDPSFFDYLLDLMTLPNAQVPPTVLICVRDSLLVTNEPLREFCEAYHDQITVYQIEKWGASSKRHFAKISLAGEADKFISMLRQRPPLDELACTPYYCWLLGEEFKASQLHEEDSEASLLEHALSVLIDRDYEKGFVNRALIPMKDVIAFLEEIAVEDFRGGYQGVPVQVVREWAELVLPSDLPIEEQKCSSDQMTYLGTFSHGSPGHIRFAQEILEHYLVGRRLVWLFENQPETFVRELAARELPKDWVTMRLVVEYVKSEGQFHKLKSMIYSAMAHPIAFRNIFQLAAMSAEQPDTLVDIPLERLDLSGLVFRGLDFHDVTFTGCNLTDVEFERCNLKNANMTSSIMNNTGFLSLEADALQGVKIGDLSQFYSIRVDRGRVISDHSEARVWFEQRTGRRPPMIEPCAAALQLRYFFNKLVYPNGTAKRSWLSKRAMLAGKSFHDSPEEMLDAAIRHGYLIEEKFRDRIQRPGGDLYSEVVGYATSLKLTSRLRAVLDDVCEGESCSHIPILE